jgi:hypothetical protein
MLSENELTILYEQSFKSRKLLEKYEKCGCGFCLRIFRLSQIIEWTDDDSTAICPYCGIDSIFPIGEVDIGVIVDIDIDVLKELRSLAFSI